jgi:hypothetical protein
MKLKDHPLTAGELNTGCLFLLHIHQSHSTDSLTVQSVSQYRQSHSTVSLTVQTVSQYRQSHSTDSLRFHSGHLVTVWITGGKRKRYSWQKNSLEFWGFGLPGSRLQRGFCDWTLQCQTKVGTQWLQVTQTAKQANTIFYIFFYILLTMYHHVSQ